ncbi:4867_t:CDS:2 [Cetraspora pellucida]|uniref:4867_t:CDS:1 n=1 Tax=Cetraspora pellucida TaxID=1433469 RepID=A0A9N9AWT1_9GLOM|nr:4867_t:CDS:2 [Cetraspora pellucida]
MSTNDNTTPKTDDSNTPTTNDSNASKIVIPIGYVPRSYSPKSQYKPRELSYNKTWGNISTKRAQYFIDNDDYSIYPPEVAQEILDQI